MFKKVSAASAAVASALGRTLPTFLRDLAGLAGVGLVAYGAWLLHPAAGYITGGTLLLVGVCMLSGANRGTGS